MMALLEDILYYVRVVQPCLKKEKPDEHLTVCLREHQAGPSCSGVLPNLKLMQEFQRDLVNLSLISDESFSGCTKQISKSMAQYYQGFIEGLFKRISQPLDYSPTSKFEIPDYLKLGALSPHINVNNGKGQQGKGRVLGRELSQRLLLINSEHSFQKVPANTSKGMEILEVFHK